MKQKKISPERHFADKLMPTFDMHFAHQSYIILLEGKKNGH